MDAFLSNQMIDGHVELKDSNDETKATLFLGFQYNGEIRTSAGFFV